MKKLAYGFLLFLVFGNANLVYARNHELRPFYLSGEAGWSSMADGYVFPYQFKNKENLGYRFSLGYLFPIKDRFGLGPEVGFGYYGKESYQNTTGFISNYSLGGWDFLANLKIIPAAHFNLYFKAGIANLFQRLVVVGPGATPGGFYQQGVDPMLEVGTSYNLSKYLELSFSYSHIFAHRAPLTSDQQFTFTNVDQICSVDAVMLGLSINL